MQVHHPRNFLGSVIGAIALISCNGPEYQLGPHGGPSDVDSLLSEDAITSGPELEFDRTFSFGDGARTPVADYLFVVDDSVSMEMVLDKFRAGFVALADSDVFPEDARIGVMNTTPADYETLRAPHAAVRKVGFVGQSPGFLRLVSGPRIVRYRELVGPRIAAELSEEGCEPWFAPDDTNSAGVPCLVAHTQIGLSGHRVEAGLNAFKQLLMLDDGGGLFRPAASVNVIFVSDTHDPGVMPNQLPEDGRWAFEELMDERPDYDELLALVEESHDISSFRVHAIAPRTQCAEGWQRLGASYFEVAEEGDGVQLDICEVDDYTELFRAIADLGSVMQRPVFGLDGPGHEVESVYVDGQSVSWSVTRGGRALVLDGLDQTQRSRVEVRYRRSPTGPGSRPGR